MDPNNNLRGPLIEARAIANDGQLSWEIHEGADGHWDNKFLVHGPDGTFLAECEYRPFAELLCVAYNHLGPLLDLAEAVAGDDIDAAFTAFEALVTDA